MLNSLLTKFYTGYPKLLKFNSIKEFEEYYNELWEEADEETQIERDIYIERSPIEKGVHTDPYDESARIQFIKASLQISLLAPNIANAIDEKDSFELQKAMFNNCISEIDLLNSQLQEKSFLLSKYPFIDEELSLLRENLFILCGHLTNRVTVFQSHQIKWLGQTNTLAMLFYDLWKGQPKDINGTSKELDPIIDAKSARVIQEFIASNFTDKDGKKWEADDFKDYFGKSDKRERVQKRIQLRYKK